jgi:hypothetical protein
MADLLGAHWHEVPTIDPSYWTVPPPTVGAIRRDPRVGRVFALGQYSAGEPGYAVRPVQSFAVRDTLAWGLAPIWGLWSSGEVSPIYDRRIYLYDLASLAAGLRFDVEGVTHLLSGSPTDFGHFGTPDRVGAAYLYRNADARPRARLEGRPLYVRDAVEAARRMRALGPLDRDRLIVEDPTRPLPPEAVADGSARIARDDPERVEVETESAGPAYLFLADAYDPGWTATVDGAPTAIRPAQVAFRAVFLPAGKHRVVFTYRPAGFDRGLAISAVGGLVALAALGCRRRVATLGDEHGVSPWPRSWPWWGLGAVGLILLASTLTIGPDGQPAVQSRWEIGFHRFTWGAKVNAIKPPPPAGF